MGYLFYAKSKQELVDSIVKDAQTNIGVEVLKQSVVSNHLWLVIKYHGKTCIHFYLMAKHGGQWGYKCFAESDHPYYYDCPLYMFNFAKDGIDESWREKVRQYHKNKYAKSKLAKTLKQGDTINLVNSKIKQVICSRIVGTKIYGVANGVEYIIPKTMIGA